MKRLIVCGALVIGGFSGLASGCGSRSSDDLYLPGVAAGDAPFSGSGGSDLAGAAPNAGHGGFGSGGLGMSGGSSGGAFAAAGSSGFVSIAGNASFAGSRWLRSRWLRSRWLRSRWLRSRWLRSRWLRSRWRFSQRFERQFCRRGGDDGRRQRRNFSRWQLGG